MFRVEVIADNSGKWAGNGLTFPTVEQAEVYARDLAWRWTLVRKWRVVPAEGGDALVEWPPPSLEDLTMEDNSDVMAAIRAQEEEDRTAMLADKVRPLIDAVNRGTSEELARAIVFALNRSHRTLQQGFMGAVKLAIAAYAAQDGAMWTDMRNQAAHDWAKQVAALRNGDLRFPLI